ncbi:bacteriochlorophyll 4-vinyl reductase [Roseiarcus sp.]|uniref:bacteriochlorophyll 4-vinyl reductase n=1 Tax=Roseiarcus sp. TaxID=1969460 RepID=UPI003F9A0A62
MTMSLAQPLIAEGRAKRSRSEGETSGRVGPNAAIQLLRVLPLAAEPETVLRILVTAGVLDWAIHPPTDMVEERSVAALHRATRKILHLEEGLAVLAEAGGLTGDYILANRIPGWARAALKALPARISSRLLAKAITAHAWTFVGSGRFACCFANGLTFEIWSNPFCVGERSDSPICAWHAAVFQRLYQALASPRARVVETHCSARGDACCRFAVNGIRK